VGFTLLAAVAGGGAFWLWIKGISIGSRTWSFRVSFADAAGLGERSAVTYRGVQVGSVRSLTTTSEAVVADLEITDPTLRLPLPLVAQVEEASLLGGDAVVALLAPSRRLPPGTPGPRDRACNRQLTVCPGTELKGINAASITSVTATMQKLLDQADKEQLVPMLADTTRSFDATSKQADRFLKEGEKLIRDLQVGARCPPHPRQPQRLHRPHPQSHPRPGRPQGGERSQGHGDERPAAHRPLGSGGRRCEQAHRRSEVHGWHPQRGGGPGQVF